MARCLISFGANLGDPLGTLHAAAELLRAKLQCSSASFRLSRFFRTPPVGGPTGQPPFVNAVAATETSLSPTEVWRAIRDVEQELGRRRNRRWEARRIDLDILLYEQARIWTPQLKIPHPRMCMRRFILVPATDVAADWVEPVSGMTVSSLATALQRNPASLILIAAPDQDAHQMLWEVSRLAMAEVIEIPNAGDSQSMEGRLSAESRPRDSSRWIALVPPDQLAELRLPPPRLFMFLAGPSPQADLAWEEHHLELAASLELIDTKLDQRQLPIAGPRYLLASDDSEWAIHEMVSALEAMDCPVEALPEAE